MGKTLGLIKMSEGMVEVSKHASTVYTKNMFYMFSKEFEKTVEYDGAVPIFFGA